MNDRKSVKQKRQFRMHLLKALAISESIGVACLDIRFLRQVVLQSLWAELANGELKGQLIESTRGARQWQQFLYHIRLLCSAGLARFCSSRWCKRDHDDGGMSFGYALVQNTSTTPRGHKT